MSAPIRVIGNPVPGRPRHTRAGGVTNSSTNAFREQKSDPSVYLIGPQAWTSNSLSGISVLKSMKIVVVIVVEETASHYRLEIRCARPFEGTPSIRK